MNTTLGKIKSHQPRCACCTGTENMIAILNKTITDDEPLPLLTILELVGLDNALWALRTIEGHYREERLLAGAYARQVQHLMDDQGCIDLLDLSERFANGQADGDDMLAAWKIAYPAPRRARLSGAPLAVIAARWAAINAAKGQALPAALSAREAGADQAIQEAEFIRMCKGEI